MEVPDSAAEPQVAREGSASRGLPPPGAGCVDAVVAEGLELPRELHREVRGLQGEGADGQHTGQLDARRFPPLEDDGLVPAEGEPETIRSQVVDGDPQRRPQVREALGRRSVVLADLEAGDGDLAQQDHPPQERGGLPANGDAVCPRTHLVVLEAHLLELDPPEQAAGDRLHREPRDVGEEPRDEPARPRLRGEGESAGRRGEEQQETEQGLDHRSGPITTCTRRGLPGSSMAEATSMRTGPTGESQRSPRPVPCFAWSSWGSKALPAS